MPKNRIERPVILGIVGDSAAGKTTLTKGIARILGEDRVAKFCTDDYHMYDREERKANKTEALDPACNYLDVLENHLELLRNGKGILKPVYNHHNGKLERPEYIAPKPYIIVEGLLGYYTREMRNSYDVKLYLDPQDKLRRQWKVKRDTEQRGYSEADVLKQLEARKDLSANVIAPQRAYADMSISFCEEPAGASNLGVRFIMRPTLPHPDLQPIMNEKNKDDFFLELKRDENNKPVDSLFVSGDMTDKSAEDIEKLIWELMPEVQHLRERAKQFMGKDFISHPLLITQLLICYHMVKAAQGISVI